MTPSNVREKAVSITDKYGNRVTLRATDPKLIAIRILYQLKSDRLVQEVHHAS